MASENFKRKTIQEVMEEFETDCRAKSTEELKSLLDRASLVEHSWEKDGGDMTRKIAIIKRILTEREETV